MVVGGLPEVPPFKIEDCPFLQVLDESSTEKMGTGHIYLICYAKFDSFLVN